MNSNAKRQEESRGEDRISSLADDVLCHILSFLPTKYAVGTSILSKRWKYVWTSVPILDFNDSLSHKQAELNYNRGERSSFSRFVCKVLSLYNLLCLRKFHLRCTTVYNSVFIDEWICAAITPYVEELDLCIPTRDCYPELPQTLYYTCENLVHLKLCYLYLSVDDSSSVSLPRLKTLLLSSVDFANDSMKKLLSGCPVLKDLCIEMEEWDNAFTWNVCSASLERLTIYNATYSLNRLWYRRFAYTLVVETPNLKHLVLMDHTTENYKMNDLSFLVSATIDVIGSDIHGFPVVQLLKDVVNVKELCCYTIDKLWDTCYDNLPVFHNLTHLRVADPQILPHLLEHSPNLKSLVFEAFGNGCDGWYMPDCVIECLLMHLEVIEIEDLNVGADEIDMIGYFLENAMVLKRMIIYSVNLDSEEVTWALKELQTFSKGSNSCQLELN